MAFFQFRKGRDEPPVAPAPAQTVFQMRRRALHRLVGAALLVLAGVIGFPLVFDNQPRPIPVDLPIVIPDKNKIAPLVVAPAAARPPASIAAAPPPATKPIAQPAAPAPALATAPAAVAPAAAPPATTAPAAAPAPPLPLPASPVPVRAPDNGEASKAQALLDGKDPAGKPAASENRFVVQIGAFAELDKVREVRQKVEAAGLKTYTQVVETKDGSRTRVRVGPFADKTEATRAADRIKKLDLPVAILAL